MCPQHIYSHALGAEITRLENLRAILANAASSLGAHRRNLDINAADFAQSAQKFHELANALAHQPQYDLANIPANQDLLDGLSLLFHLRGGREVTSNDKLSLLERLLDSHPELQEAFKRFRAKQKGKSTQQDKSHLNNASRDKHLRRINRDLIDSFEDLAKYMVKVLDNNLRTRRGEEASKTAQNDEQNYLLKLQQLKKQIHKYFLEHDFDYQQIIEDVLGTSVYEVALIEFGCTMWGVRQQVPVNVTELANELGINPGQIETPSHHANPMQKHMKPKPTGENT